MSLLPKGSLFATIRNANREGEEEQYTRIEEHSRCFLLFLAKAQQGHHLLTMWPGPVISTLNVSSVKQKCVEIFRGRYPVQYKPWYTNQNLDYSGNFLESNYYFFVTWQNKTNKGVT